MKAFMITGDGYYLVESDEKTSLFSPARSIAASTHPQEWSPRDRSLLCHALPMSEIMQEVGGLPADSEGNVVIDKKLAERIREISRAIAQHEYPVLQH